MYELQDVFRENYDLAKTTVNTIFTKDKYRITVLSASLIRFEYSESGEFEDRPTEVVLCRNFKNTIVNSRTTGNVLIVETEYFRLEYDTTKPFFGAKVMPGNTLRVFIKNTDKMWYFGHPEARNLGGTYPSLDNLKSIKLMPGLYSPDGFATLDDSTSKVVEIGGALESRPSGIIDQYLFIYRDDFKTCLNDYYHLTGKPPLLPKWALGVWYGKDKVQTTEQIMSLVQDFKNNSIPLSILTLSSKWHTPNNNTESGFNWNKDYVPNPKLLSDYLHNNHVKLGLTINPSDGIYPTEELYSKAATYLAVNNNQVIPTNFNDPKWVDVFLKLFLHPLEIMGTDFFINNWNTNQLSTINRYLYLDNNRTNQRGLILSRNGLKAAHRYPVHYTGSIKVGFDTLAMLPKFNMAGANIGLSWISHDIGGYVGGIENPELYLRFLQLGCFSPILRLNEASGKYYKRLPWSWDIKTNTIATNFLRLRYKLLPYLYSEAYRYHKDGDPLIKPLYYEDISLYDSSLYQNQYRFGSQLLVAPITTPMDPIIKRSILRLYLPKGDWYDLMTGKKYKGNTYYMSFYKEEEYPVFAAAGAIVPVTNQITNSLNNPSEIEISFYPGASNSYNLYEDDGTTKNYQAGDYAVTNINYVYNPDQYTVNIKPLEGKFNVLPEKRTYTLRFKNTTNIKTVNVVVNNQTIPTINYYERNDLIIKINNIIPTANINVQIAGEHIDVPVLRLINDEVDSIINDLLIDTRIKEKISEIIFSDDIIKKKRIQVRKLKNLGLDNRTINVFLKLLEYVDTI